MANSVIKIRYKIRVTRQVRVETRIRYSFRTMTIARYLVEQSHRCGETWRHDELVETARTMLPAGTAEDEIRSAIDAVCEELDKDRQP